MPSCTKSGDVNELERLGVIKSLVTNGCMDYSKKVRNCIDDESYGTDDLRSCIFTANNIHKVEKDDLGLAVDGNKYTIYGRDTYGNPFYVCGKIILGNDSQRRYFLITAHERS
jgi:hypothetical protein